MSAPNRVPIDGSEAKSERDDDSTSLSPSETQDLLAAHEEGHHDAAAAASGTMTRSMFYWDVKMAPLTKHIKVGGRLVRAPIKTAAILFFNKSRRITIEIRAPPDKVDTDHSWLPLGKTRTMRCNIDNVVLRNQETVLFRAWKKEKKSGNDDSDGSDDDMPTMDGIDDGEENVVWSERGRCRLEAITVSPCKHRGRVCEVRLGTGRELLVRDVKFNSEQDCTDFQTVIEKMKALEHERAVRQLAKYRTSHDSSTSASRGVPPGLDETEVSEDIKLLVEIVSATDVASSYNFLDSILDSIDAYVVVKMGGKDIHRTGFISNTVNPIWTLDSGCFFLLEMTPEEFFGATGGMSFLIKDHDSFTSNEVLGRATIPLKQLLESNGEREAYNIIPDKKTSPGSQGKLYVRIKKASPDDVEFMRFRNQTSKEKGVYTEETFLPIRPPSSKLLSRRPKEIGDHLKKLTRVKPFPDPGRPEGETKWMTEEKIQEEAMKPSTHWVEAGSGSLGRIYLEIIGCDNLPKSETALLHLLDKMDPFACIVFEDSIVNTDVITDSSSPRWMPWCRRGFVFNVSHPASNVMLGVFDYNAQLNPLHMASIATSDLHDPIGRIIIDIPNALPNTTYTVTYPLYFGDLPEQRETMQGTITVRVRKEVHDMRKALVYGTMPPPPTYVSVASGVDFSVAHYTTTGAVDDKSFSLTTFAKHIEEIQSYQVLLEYIKEAALTVWLWRGHFEVTVAGKKVFLPLHSFTAFIWGVLVSWDFNFFPSFLAFSVGWIMLAINGYGRRTPSPWHKPRQYGPLFLHLLFNTTHTETIVANQDLEAIAAYNKQVEDRVKRLEREKELEAEHEKRLRDELFGEAEEVDIATDNEGMLSKITVNPVMLQLKPVLYPIQKDLRKAVMNLRIATSIVTWGDRIYAFWITTISFAVAIAFFWLPWGFVLRWILRVTVLVVLGPWMAIVDHCYFRENPNMTDEERDEEIKNRLQSRYTQALEAAANYQIKKEQALKRKALSQWMFGKYLLRVPRFSDDLCAEVPLPSSFAEPYDPESAPAVHIAERIYGQNLSGDMIPQREIQVATAGKRGIVGIFMNAGLEGYFADAYGWAIFPTVIKAAYFVGVGYSTGKVYVKRDGKEVKLVGKSTMVTAHAGWTFGAKTASEIIFFQDEDAFKRFSGGKLAFELGANVSVITLSADSTARTTGTSLMAGNSGNKSEAVSGRYHNGMATFVIGRIGAFVDVSVGGQKFSYTEI